MDFNPARAVPEEYLRFGKLNKQSDIKTNIAGLLHEVEQNRSTHNLT